MPSSTFEVESHTVTADTRGYYTYRLFVISPAADHGIRTRAHVNFLPADQLPSNQGWAFNVGGLNSDAITVHAYADEKHFESMHHILQTEDPVTFRYGYQSGDSTTRNLYDFVLVTGDEPTGEGVADAGLMALVSAGELNLEEIEPEEMGVEDIEVLRPDGAFDEEIRAAR